NYLSEQTIPRTGLSPAGITALWAARTPDWVRPANLRAVSVPCRGKFSPCVTTRTRPLPTYPEGQLI
ncbi:MAG: hypothetical protein V3U02_07560, partial [Calditrichia bacterium]